MNQSGACLHPPWMGCQYIAGLPPAFNSPVPNKTWVERGTVGVKCLSQDHNLMPLARDLTRTAPSRDKPTN